ncbi:MAG: fused MFS/spermidine synthase [Bacteroidales bacterium]|nr:fused MFS/spermidine synthase [Bacteroidales bacterium]
MKKFFLEIVVFVCGSVVMAYEIIGSRMLGPNVGTSYEVWTSIIGIILLSLSLGYYFGGKISDNRPSASLLAGIIVSAGLFILISSFVKDALAGFFLNHLTSLPLVSIIISLLLFSVPAFLLGMVSPFAARLKIKSVHTSGYTVGYLYAISTIGSITGTFLAGFYLIPAFRITVILVILAAVLLFFSIILYIVYKDSLIHHSNSQT